MRDVEPGEIVIVDGTGLRSIKPFTKQPRRFCVFEHIYFARPDSKIEGVGVYEARKKIGAELAKESPVTADVVVPVPDSGVPAAIGYAQQSGLPFELGIIRNHYVGRTFIEPADNIRHLGVRLKHNANRALIEGKRVILVDDSIVRGTTSMKIVEMVRSAGAREVHMRIAAPPTTAPVLLRRRHARARQAAGLALRRGRHGEVHRRRFAGFRLDRRALSRHGHAAAATPRRPPSATPASPATIRSRSTTSSASRTASSPSSPSRPDTMRLQPAAIALITGASRGLGAAAALAFAKEGAHCVLVARTVGGLEALDDRIKAAGGSATLVPLDVTDGPGIDRLGAALYERFRKLDILLGNAGLLGTLSPIGHIEPEIFERVMAVNVTANWRLIRSLDPLLRQSDAGRAIFVTSGAVAASCPTGAPTPRARRRSTCWSASMPPNAPTRMCGSTSTIPAQRAPACARRPFPARIRSRCGRPRRMPKA